MMLATLVIAFIACDALPSKQHEGGHGHHHDKNKTSHDTTTSQATTAARIARFVAT